MQTRTNCHNVVAAVLGEHEARLHDCHKHNKNRASPSAEASLQRCNLARQQTAVVSAGYLQKHHDRGATQAHRHVCAGTCNAAVERHQRRHAEHNACSGTEHVTASLRAMHHNALPGKYCTRVCRCSPNLRCLSLPGTMVWYTARPS